MIYPDWILYPRSVMPSVGTFRVELVIGLL